MQFFLYNIVYTQPS